MTLVLHADDLGMNRAVTDGVLRGFRQGLLTSTSVLASAPDAERALSEWKELLGEQAAGRLPSAKVRRKLGDPDCSFDLGVHLNLTQGRPLGHNALPMLLDVMKVWFRERTGQGTPTPHFAYTSATKEQERRAA